MAAGQDWRCVFCGRPSPSHALVRACVCGADSWRLAEEVSQEPLTNATGCGMIGSSGNDDPRRIPMTSKPSKTQITDSLRDVYLYVFDNFAVSVSETAEHFGISKDAARRMLHNLSRARIVCSADVNDEAQGSRRSGQYKEVVWQAVDSYDDYTHEQAVIHFNEAYGLTDNEETNTMSTITESPAVTPGSVVVKQGDPVEVKADPKPSAAKAAPAKPEAPKTIVEDGLYADLEKAVKALKPKPELKTAPSGSYTAIKVNGKPIGYFHPVTRKGISIHLTVAKAEVAKLVKGLQAEDHTKGAVRSRVTITKRDQVEKVITVLAATAKEAAAK